MNKGLGARALLRFTCAVVALASLAGCSARAEKDGVVEVAIEHSAFMPSVIEVDAGSTVRFVVANGDPIDHEFIIGDEDVQQRHEDGTEKEHGAIPGEISVPAGSTAETTFTFDEPGELIFGCHLPRHYDYGMRGRIVVR